EIITVFAYGEYEVINFLKLSKKRWLNVKNSLFVIFIKASENLAVIRKEICVQIISYGVQVKSLRESCKLKAVLNSFECDEAVQEMRRMLIDKGQKDTSNLFTIVKNDLGIEILPWCIEEEVSLVIQQNSRWHDIFI
ncbi:hypothetical protein Avbf_12872, partial [Armadillidium vulgare]